MSDKAEYMRRWRAANKDRVAESTRAWRAKNPDRVKAHRKTTYENHRDSRIYKVVRRQQTPVGRAARSVVNAKYNLAQLLGVNDGAQFQALLEAKIAFIRLTRVIYEMQRSPCSQASSRVADVDGEIA